jgi:hypothetical protein
LCFIMLPTLCVVILSQSTDAMAGLLSFRGWYSCPLQSYLAISRPFHIPVKPLIHYLIKTLIISRKWQNVIDIMLKRIPFFCYKMIMIFLHVSAIVSHINKFYL